ARKPLRSLTLRNSIEWVKIPLSFEHSRTKPKKRRCIRLRGFGEIVVGYYKAIVRNFPRCETARHRSLRNPQPAEPIQNWLKKFRAGERFFTAGATQCRYSRLPDFCDFTKRLSNILLGGEFRSAGKMAN